jgi:hypothetical protein
MKPERNRPLRSGPIGTRAVVASVVAAVSLSAATAVRGSDSPAALSFHYDPGTGTARAFLEAADGTVLASHDWPGFLPSGFDSAGDSYYVPTRLLGQLRDAVERSRHPDAGEATAWLRVHMGFYAYAPTSSIPLNQMSGIPLGTETSEWCGDKVDTDKHCLGTCFSPCGVQSCCNCACKGTKTFLSGRS